MDATGASPAGEDLTQFSDEELLRRFIGESKEHAEATVQLTPAQDALVQELWRRHAEAIVYRCLKILVFGRESVCPVFYDRQTFLDSSYSRAYINLRRRLRGFRINDPFFKERFQKWLEAVARTAALDERRVVIRGPRVLDERESADVSDTGREGSSHSSGTEEEESTTPAGLGRAQPVPSPSGVLTAEERRLIVRELLKRHAMQSEENAHSAYTIELRLWLDWTLAKTGEYFNGEPCGARERNTQEVAVRRTLLHDFQELRRLLANDFGITSFREI